jgi:integrase
VACIRKRRGVWAVDAYVAGRRVVKTYQTKREAEDALARVRAVSRPKGFRPRVDPFITLADFVPRFLSFCEQQEAVSTTVSRYRRQFDNHITPVLGHKKIRDLTRADVRSFLLDKGQDGQAVYGVRLARNTVRQLGSVLSSALSLAVDDEIINTNPARDLDRKVRTKAARVRGKVREHVKAMDREQRNAFLALAARRDEDIYVSFLLMALAGLRLDEALGLKWEHVDLAGRRLHIREQLLSDSTKSGVARYVDMARTLADVLESVKTARTTAAYREDRSLRPYVVFPWLTDAPDAKEEQKAAKRIRRAMTRTLTAAGLPTHFTPHALRHTFCSLLIREGVSPVYVQQQAGHASVEMTVGVYGSWFPMEAPGAMDRLAEGTSAAAHAEGLVEALPVGNPPSTGSSSPSDLARPFVPSAIYRQAGATRPSPG